MTSFQEYHTTPSPLPPEPHSLRQRMAAEGYIPGTPQWGDASGAAIDRAVAAKSTCDACRHAGLDYEPYVRIQPRSYRAFVVCPACGVTVEF